jgi:hypothetical protein
MDYSENISFFYTILAILITTLDCSYNININYNNLHQYNKYDGETTAKIVNKKCNNTINDLNSHISSNITCDYYEYTVNNINYSRMAHMFIGSNSDVNKNNEINILYKKSDPNVFITNNDSDVYFYNKKFLIIILLFIIIIILWIFLFIIVMYDNFYNKYIHFIYAIILTSLLSYYFASGIKYYYYDIIGNYYYDSYTIGTVINNDTIEYNIKNNKETLKYYSNDYDLKIGDKVYLLYYENISDDIRIYDIKSKIPFIVKSILLIIVILLIWLFLFYNIQYILK